MGFLVEYERVFTGSSCNNDCLHCKYKDRGSNPEFGQIIAEIGQGDKFDGVEFYGGEPTIRSDFIPLVNAARKKGFKRIKVITNGRSFSSMDTAINTIDAGCHLFEVKVHGPNPGIHDGITQRDGSFWQTLEGIENLRSINIINDEPFGAFIGIRICICRENYRDIENIAATFMRYRIDRIILSFEDHTLLISEALPHIRNAINIGILNRVWSITEKIPLCVMKGFEHHVSEIYSVPDTRYKQHKNCATCVYNSICPGVNKDYLKRFGFDEFSPLKDSRYLEDILGLQDEKD